MWLTDTNFSLGKNFEVENFEVENFQLLTMIFSENFLSVENFLEWKWALINIGKYTWLNLLQATLGI